jgi:sialic acid synthase
MGSEIIEKHITLDRNMKGTDQIGSLGPEGIYRMVRDLRLLNMSLGKKELHICDDVKGAQIKLERSIATNKTLSAGQKITENDIHLLSPGDGFKWTEKNNVFGKTASCEIPKNEIVYPKMLS